MLPKSKHTHIFTALFVCGVAVTALALNSVGISRLISPKLISPKPASTSATSKNTLRYASAAFAPAPMMFQGPGIAPTGDPGGFHIEGNLQANTPTNNVSDWIPNGVGTGVGVLNASGAPINTTRTFHPIDTYDSNTDNIFAGGNKVDDNPNAWTWVTQKAPAKDDIHNGLVHTSTDSNGDLWFVVSGDRLSNNGDSYIDFEFLQNTLTANANGTFTSAGPNGGRTVGDLLVTIEFVNGGVQPDFFVERWQAVGSGFDYVDITPPDGAAFVAANIAGTVSVPYGAFGSTTYQMNSFGEAAINVTDLIQGLDPCIGIKSVLIKTKTSQSPTATIKDFITPIQLNIGNEPVANAGPDLTRCQAIIGTTDFSIDGTAMNGTAAWTYVSSTGSIQQADVNIVSPNNADTDVKIANGKTGTVTLRLRVTSSQCGFVDDLVTLTVTAGAVANAGPDMTKCQPVGSNQTVFNITGSGTNPALSYSWAQVGSTGGASSSISGGNTLTPTVTVTGTGTVTLRLTVATITCGSAQDEVTLTVNPSPTSNAGNDQILCLDLDGMTNFTGVGVSVANGAPSWSIVSASGSITGADVQIVSPNSAVTNVNILNGKTGAVTLALTSTSAVGCGSAVDEVVLTVNPAATVNAGADQTVCSTSPSVTLAGVIGGGATSAIWSGGSGSFNPNNTTLNAVYTPSAAEITAGTVTLTLTTNDPAGPCGAAIDQMVITINRAATVNAGADQTVCSSSPNVTLAGVIGGGATSATWSGGTGSFNPNNSTLNAVYTPSAAEIAAGTVTLTLTTNDPAGPCGAVNDTMVITINPAATVNAGSDQTVCATSPNVTLAGVIGGGATSATWSGGTGTFNPNNTTLNAVYTPSAAEIAAGTATLTLTTNDPAGPCGVASDTMVITINPAATVNAGADQTVCSTSPNVTLAGVIGGGATSATWSGGTGTFNPNNTTLNAVYTPSAAEIVAGTVTLTLTTNDPQGPCGSATDSMVITINPAATVNAGADQTVCSTSPNLTLAGVIGGGANSATWSGGTGTFNPNNTTLNAVYTPSAAEIAAGTVTLTLTTNDPAGPCGAASDTMVITINPAATVNAGADQTVCGTSPNVTLAGVIGGGATSATWSGGTGTFNPSNTTLNAVYTPSAAEIAAGTVTLTLTTNDPAGPCGAASDTMVITISPVVTVNAGPDQTVCSSSSNVTLAGVIGGGATSATWSGGTGTFNPNNTTLNAVYTPSGAEITAGTVTLTLTTNDPAGPCGAANDQMAITINRPPTVNAGADQSLPACASTQVQLAGSIGGGATSATWSSSGSGSFSPDANTLNAVYKPSPADLNAGSVALTLTTNDPAGPCAASSDTAVITFVACPSCFKEGPGSPLPERSEVSDQKAGSVLIYNLYTSSTSTPDTQDTRINLTNVSSSDQVAVHLFFVDGASCSVADSYICLTPNQTSSFLASDFDPGTTGYLIAVASSCVTGCPIAFNCLIGDAYVKFSSGHAANLGAEALSAVSPNPTVCDPNSVTATLNFDGVSYNRMPRLLAADNVPSLSDGNNTMLVLNRVGGSLMSGLNSLSTVFGVFYNDTETPASFSFSGGCQLRSSLSNSFPRISPRFDALVPSGRSGWFKLSAANDSAGGIFGATINFNPNAASVPGAFNQGHNMHALTLTPSATLTVPIIPPSCCR